MPKGLKGLTKVTAKAKGWVPGFRVWVLCAYDDSSLVLKIDKDYGNNRAKFEDFMKQLYELDYALTYPQVKYLTEKLLLDWCPPPSVTNDGLMAYVPYGSSISKAAKRTN